LKGALDVSNAIRYLPVLALAGLTPAPASAQDEAPPPAAPAATTTPSLESLQADLQRHDEELKQLRDALARRDEEAIVAQEREAMERERAMRIYGFADVGVLRNIVKDDAYIASQFRMPLTFYLGRLNLYYDVRPASDFRFLAETRISLYPNGSVSGTNSRIQVERTSTLVNDVAGTNPSAKVSWGSIIVERAALDWTRYPLLSVRAGLFLTPFGIYNVDHGTPTLITISLPIYISQGWIPERQTGVQIFGSHVVDRWELGYAATVSNGRTDGLLDAGDSKAFGGRLFAKRQGELRLILGVSALYQPYRRDLEQFGMDESGGLTYTSTRVVERDVLTVGNDIAIDYRGLRVRNELVFYQVEYAPGKRDAPPEGRGGLAPDSRQLNWSLVVAYRVWKVEPYVRSEYFFTSPSAETSTHAVAPGVGLNFYFRPNVILKACWTHPMFFLDNDPENTAAKRNFHGLSGVLTWAF
jgi:hypothetical protein